MNQRRFFGIAVVVMGVLFLLNSLNIGFDVWRIISTYWPLILIIIGIINLVGTKGIRLPGVLMIAVGLIYLLDTTNMMNINIDAWEVLVPLFIIVIGVWLLFPKSGNKTTGKDFIRQMVLFSGAEVDCNSDEFKGADLFAMFGGLDVDLREIQISRREGAKIDAFVGFGGIDIIVPKDITVKVTGIPLFGGWGNKAMKPVSGEDADLIINVFVMFGGLDVKAKRSKRDNYSYEE